MAGTSLPWPARACATAIILVTFGPAFASAERSDDRRDRDHQRPVYQRRAFERHDRHDHKHHRGRAFFPHSFAPPAAAGWFQRPYPYHLDYYRMRYGGSYAPYFGNLYGPPQVVTAPPYYGPYYGGYGNGYPGEYGQPGNYGYPAPPPSNESVPTP